MCLHCETTLPLQHSLRWMWHPKHKRPGERLSNHHIIILVKKDADKTLHDKCPSGSKAIMTIVDYLISCAPSFFVFFQLSLPQSSLSTYVPFLITTPFSIEEKKKEKQRGKYLPHPKPGTESQISPLYLSSSTFKNIKTKWRSVLRCGKSREEGRKVRQAE